MEFEGKGLVNESQAEYLLPARNVMETSLGLAALWTRTTRTSMLQDTAGKILETLNDNEIPDAIIGGLAISHQAAPIDITSTCVLIFTNF